MKKTALLAAALVIAALPAYAASPKTYQVTGPVTEITPTTITVLKGQDKWEIGHATGSVPPSVKVGSKVTITYTMSANTIVAKDATTK